jgi:hypothetical protein
MNAYEELTGVAAKQEVRDLAIMTLLLPDAQTDTDALNEAWGLLVLAAEFLKKKREERDTTALDYWASPEGLARAEDIRKRYGYGTDE